MSRHRLKGGLLTLCLLLGCRFAYAIDPILSTDLEPIPPPTADSAAPAQPVTPVTAPATPALAVPAQSVAAPGFDASTIRKFYTISASLRETYDDNIGTSNNNTQASYDTAISPSILVNLPNTEGSFTGRYTMNLTYYTQPGTYSTNTNGGSSNNDSLDLTHELSLFYTHVFSERYALTLAEQFRYFTEPSLDQGTGTVYRSGAYVNNTINGSFSAQLTPRLGTSTTFADTIVRYDNSEVGDFQDNVENTVSQTVSFAMWPTISLSLGGIYDNITYKDNFRGYSNYTAFFGTDWTVSPVLSMSGRGGVSYAVTVSNQTSISPYIQYSLNWTLGERSSLNFNYSHEMTPSDQANAQGQSSDRASVGFRYSVTPRLTAHLGGALTSSTVSQSLIVSQQTAPVSTQEVTYYVDSSLSYHFDKYIDFNTGITLSANLSNIDQNSYVRRQIYCGISGTY